MKKNNNKITIESLNDLFEYLNNNKSGKKNWEIYDNKFNLILQSGEKDTDKLYCYKEVEINEDKLYFGSTTFHIIDTMLNCINNKRITGKVYYSFGDLAGQSRFCRALFSLTDFIQMTFLIITTLLLIASYISKVLMPVVITLEIITICLVKLGVIQSIVLRVLTGINRDKILAELKSNSIMKGGKEIDKV